jgi:hypothetical protein
LPDLVHVGVQAVCLAFRTGTYVHEIGQRLSPTSDESASWTYIFAGLGQDGVAAKLDEFHALVVSVPR